MSMQQIENERWAAGTKEARERVKCSLLPRQASGRVLAPSCVHQNRLGCLTPTQCRFMRFRPQPDPGDAARRWRARGGTNDNGEGSKGAADLLWRALVRLSAVRQRGTCRKEGR